MTRTTVLVLAAGFLALAQQPATPDFGPKFRAATQQPDQIVPLILEVSEALPKVDGDTGRALADALEPFCRQVFFGPGPIPGAERLGVVKHEVKSGELPGAIAKRLKTGAGMLKYLNANYDDRRVAAGAKLNVLDLSDGSLQLIVDITRRRLASWHKTPEGKYVLALYVPVGVGAEASPTPVGKTKIVDRVRNPAWTEPKTKQVFPHGDPGNVLGGYWIKLDPEGLGGVTGIGLHGYTGAPAVDWLEQGSSSGCIRMLQPDIDRVFELALEGTPVTLTK